MSRRKFLHATTAGVAGAAVGGAVLLSPRTARGYAPKSQVHPNISNTRVVFVHDETMATGGGSYANWSQQNSQTNETKVAANIDKMARALAEEVDTPTAWRKIFLRPASKPSWSNVVVAIKTNNIAQQHTRNAVMKKFCTVLTSILGVQGSNIHIYDGVHGGNMTTTTPFSGLPTGVIIENAWGGLSATTYLPPPIDANTSCVAAIANGTVDILINIALCKGHGNEYGRFTMTMKHHFGTCSPNHSIENLIAINKSEAILGAMDGGGQVTFPKQQLCFIDALYASQDGPDGAPSARTNRFFMGTFSPILDYLAATLFRRDTMGWPINAAIANQFLSDFGYTTADLPGGGVMIDALTWTKNAAQNWSLYS
jgi:hypothetical protein